MISQLPSTNCQSSQFITSRPRSLLRCNLVSHSIDLLFQMTRVTFLISITRGTLVVLVTYATKIPQHVLPPDCIFFLFSFFFFVVFLIPSSVFTGHFHVIVDFLIFSSKCHHISTRIAHKDLEMLLFVQILSFY